MPARRVISTRAAPPATARTRTPTEAQADYRAGRRATGRSPLLTWSAPRNGFPFKPYVYRGGRPDDGRAL
jgi:hypothetical protein